MPPDMMTIIKIIENCSTSMFMACTTGRKMGVSRSMVAVPSTKQPAMMQMMETKASTPN